MGILEIIAEERLGKSVLAHNSQLKSRLRKIEQATGTQSSPASAEEKQRIAMIVELCFEYDAEKKPDERENILRTLNEVAINEAIGLPTETVEQWRDRLAAGDRGHAKLMRKEKKRTQEFLKRYFLLRAKAGLKTQADVAKRAGLSRTHVTALESAEHTPQQKTLQKLAKAFGVEVTDLM